MRNYTLHYLFNGQPRSHTFELEQPDLTVHDAAMHLLQLHIGDGENSLLMPNAEATPTEILAQAEVVGLSAIRIVDQLDQ
ncbi:hypothetical protein GIW70_06470 [Pseudomonas syringae]|nr:hypothetical protein [Pseudomonas syringae]MCF5067842.1 hypothetical protein [Pseudomonas syringae]